MSSTEHISITSHDPQIPALRVRRLDSQSDSLEPEASL
jgi:hypothetical protein